MAESSKQKVTSREATSRGGQSFSKGPKNHPPLFIEELPWTKDFRERLELVTSESYVCTTTELEMVRMLEVCWIKLPNHHYSFEVLTGERHCLSEVSDEGGIFLPLYIFESGFHLPLHSFAASVLRDLQLTRG